MQEIIKTHESALNDKFERLDEEIVASNTRQKAMLQDLKAINDNLREIFSSAQESKKIEVKVDEMLRTYNDSIQRQIQYELNNQQAASNQQMFHVKVKIVVVTMLIITSFVIFGSLLVAVTVISII